MNSIIVNGNLGRDWELKYSQAGKAYANNSIAVRRDFKNAQGEYETDWLPLTAFGKTAETLAQYTQKGSKILVQGSLQTNRNDEGKTFYNVIINRFDFLDSRQAQQQGNQFNNQNHQSNQQSNQDPFSTQTSEIDADDLPF